MWFKQTTVFFDELLHLLLKQLLKVYLADLICSEFVGCALPAGWRIRGCHPGGQVKSATLQIRGCHSWSLKGPRVFCSKNARRMNICSLWQDVNEVLSRSDNSIFVYELLVFESHVGRTAALQWESMHKSISLTRWQFRVKITLVLRNLVQTEEVPILLGTNTIDAAYFGSVGSVTCYATMVSNFRISGFYFFGLAWKSAKWTDFVRLSSKLVRCFAILMRFGWQL